MKIITCDHGRHAIAILAIFNDVIMSSTALYDYKPRTIESMRPWFEAKAKADFPVVGIESDEDELLGFASYGIFRAWPAYKYTVEHSLYVDRRSRGRGLGKILLGEIIERARRQDYHTMVGGIDASNDASIRLHQQMGFRHCGTISHAGFKFGRWLDLAFYQLTLETPNRPIDG